MFDDTISRPITARLLVVAGCVLAAVILAAVPLPAVEAPLVISGETLWQGTVNVAEDVLVTETGHLTIQPGTQVVVAASEGTRTDPQFYSTETELVVRGRLTVGAPGAAPVLFRRADPASSWGGIIADGPHASLTLDGVTVDGAHAGLTLFDATATLTACTLTNNVYGMVLLGAAKAALRDTRLGGNEYGLADYAGGATLDEKTAVSGNRERDRLDRSPLAGWKAPDWWRLPYRHRPAPGETEYLGDQAINVDTTWSGRVIIRGQVAVQAGAILTIQAGTEVAFRKLDTNGDGLGESQLLVLGTLKVEGTEENWVLFTSAEAEKSPGDWDKVSLISSESPGNLVRYARFEYGYQAFHSHFSTAHLEAVIFADNYRGVQFQESAGMSVAGAWFTRNKSAMRFRDSLVTLSDILVEGNLTGINYLRCKVSLTDSAITGTLADPLLGRESQSELKGVIVDGNREGPRFKGDGSSLLMEHCAVHRNLEDGLAMTDTVATIDRVDLSGNGLDGLSVTGGTVTVTNSDLSLNGRWALDNNGAAPVAAGKNWWGTTDPAMLAKLIYDGKQKTGVGLVNAADPLASPPGLFFTGSEPAGESFAGGVFVLGDFAWPAGRPLTLAPGTRVEFHPLSSFSPFDCCREHPNFAGGELILSGSRVNAVGTPERPVEFTIERKPGAPWTWGAINVEAAAEARFSWCLFKGADTGLHLRDSSGSIEHSRFEGNRVGLRFNTSKLAVRDNLFLHNGAGLRFHYGEPEISGNTFRENDKAIFITDDPRSFSISGNTFIDSREYDLSLGETVEQDIPITGNFFGGSGKEGPGTLATKQRPPKLFDRATSPHLGRVIWEPAAAKPLPEPAIPPPGP